LILSAIVSGGGLMLFLDAPSLAIVLGGVVSATLMSFPLGVAKGTPGIVARAFLHKAPSQQEIMELLIKYADMARRDGMLALEEEAEKAPDEFLKKGLRLAVDGTDADLIGTILNLELTALKNRHKDGQAILKGAADYAPAFGMIGTLIGLIQMLQVLDDPSKIGGGMAVALVTSFWGAFLANTTFLPLAAKLKNRSAEEAAVRKLIIQGITSIQGGDSPRIVKEKLQTFLAPKLRLEVEKAAEKA
ncbi:MAG: motility protein A, partial [Gemmatimonadetes bacterium]|nr:motility protein A [Gemmatimonadota bacterium]